jgi:hypothetical protein
MERREISRINATSEKQVALSKQLAKKYQPIADRAALEKLSAGKVMYGFCMLRGGEDFTLIDFLARALLRASSDPKDSAFSEHGARHGTFQEVTEDLISSLQFKPSEVKATLQPTILGYETKNGIVNVTVNRLILRGKEKIRRTFRPAPHQLALEIKSYIDENPRTISDEKTYIQKVLRKTAGELGVPFSIMTGVYLLMETNDITEVFNNKDVRVKIKEARKEKGINQAKIPTPDMPTWQMISNLRRFVLVPDKGGIRPNFEPNAYLDALGVFPHEYSKDFDERLKKFEETDDTVIPKAVFCMLEEVAQREAAPDFLDPYRSEYIHKTYANVATSNLITAFYEFSLPSTDYHFMDLLKVNGNGSKV